MAEENENADFPDPPNRRDIWRLFHYELTLKAIDVQNGARNLCDSLGNVYEVSPEEEISRIKAFLEREDIERNLKDFREHLQKMEELLKTVRQMQDKQFGVVETLPLVPL
jgi:DNA repair exonuclease SbcCD ATPase subunit